MKNADPRAADRPAGSRLPCGPIPTTPYRLPVGWFSGAYYHNPISAACGLVFCRCIISGSLTIKRPLRSGGLTTPGAPRPNSVWGPYMGGRNGVSKGIEDGRRAPTLRVDHPENARKAVSGVAKPQSAEG
jgi:hypothetical protein